MFNPHVESNSNQLKDITEKFNSGIDIGVIAFLFNKSRWFIVLFFAVAFSVAFVYLRYSQPIYESMATIQIDDGNQAADILKLSNGSDNDNILAKAREQISSEVFLRRVVEKLDISVNYYSEGTFKNNELYHLSPYLIRINVRNKAAYGQKLYVELNSALTGGVIKGPVGNYYFNINEWVKTADFDVNVFLNQKFDTQQINQIVRNNKALYFIVADMDAVTAGLKSKLDVKEINPLAKTLQIKVSDVNALKTADIVNAITEEYLDYDVDFKSESSRNILSFIDSQLDVVYNELKNTEND